MASDKTSRTPPSKPTAPAPGDEAEAPEQQDRSIKARKSSMFDSHEADVGTTQPFSEFVKTVPASPLSAGAKAALIGVGVIVVLLLLAAIFSAGNHGQRRRRADATIGRPALALRGSGIADRLSRAADRLFPLSGIAVQ